jgi:hypothetical protein
LLKLGKEKRALKVAKHRVSSRTPSHNLRQFFASLHQNFPNFDHTLQLGGHSRGKAKRDQMASVLQKQKMTKH